MKLFTKYFYVILLFLLAATACNHQAKGTKQAAIQSTLDSLKSIYALDTRIALWDVTINWSSDTLSINGELDNKKAVTAMAEVIGQKCPEFEINIKLLPEGGNEQLITGLINNSVANLRSNPRHSAEIATQALLGTPIRILKKQGEWYLVQTPNKYIAWIDDDGLVIINQKELKTYRQQHKIVYNNLSGFSYSEANVKSQTVSDLVLGCILPVLSSKRKFYQVQYPDKRLAWVRKSEVIDFEELSGRQINTADLVETAKEMLGFPYLWGGTSAKAIDCSGFTSTIYYMDGIVLQRDASQQTKYGKEITTVYKSKNLLPGDLLFFGRKATDSFRERVTHVAMYIGDTEFIHASGKVRINSIDSTRQNFIPEYVPRFVRAVRIKGEIDGNGIERMSNNVFYKEIIRSTK